MKIEKNKSKKKILFASFSAMASFSVLVAMIFAYHGLKNNSRTPTTNAQTGSTGYLDLNPPTNDQRLAGELVKKDSVNSKDIYETKKELSHKIVFTAVNQTSDRVLVRALIQGVYNEGECLLVLSNGKKELRKNAGVQAAPSSTTCKGFDILLSELSPGPWDVALVFSNSSVVESVRTSLEVK